MTLLERRDTFPCARSCGDDSAAAMNPAHRTESLRISPWEGHPNEKANRVFAQEFAKVLRDLPAFQAYMRNTGDGAGLRHAGTRPGRGPGQPERLGSPGPGQG
jgi:hypothetical protein